MAALAVPGVAHAEGAYTGTSVVPPVISGNETEPVVLGSTNTRPETAPVQSTHSTLPFTGADVVELTLVGAAAIGAGTFLVRRGRRTA